MAIDQKELIITPEQYGKLSNLTDFHADMIGVLHKTVAKGTTLSELGYFLSVCKSIGLNPLNKEVWCYKDTKDNLLVFTGRDGFLKKGQEHPRYNGLRSCEVCEKDDFWIDIANNLINHKFGTADRGKIIGAYSIAFLRDGEPTIEWSNIKDYDKNRNTWNTNQADMIKKVSECHALKKAFGISNLVSEYDFEVKDNIAYARSNQKPPMPQDKSEERLLELIRTRKTRQELEALLKEVNTGEARDLYDEMYKILK